MNTGVEFQLNGEILRPVNDGLGINASLSFSYNKNEVKKIEHLPASGFEALRSLHEGYPINSIFSYRYAGMVTGEGEEGSVPTYGWYDSEGNIQAVDIASNLFTVDDVVYCGGRDPKYVGSFTPEITYKGFTLSAMLSYYGGHYMRAHVEDWSHEGTYRGYSESELGGIPSSYLNYWTTADNGKLPPWKGDYHHDLNTELSYWPAYAGNHLTEGMGYLNTLWNQRNTYRQWTRQYFGTDGLNVTGVATLTGEAMGGWSQYAMSQTAGAWLAHHFYLHWKYSADNQFLAERGYPFVRDVATYMEQQSSVDAQGRRTLEFSSSPEIFDNSLQAWFKTMTNFDLAMMHSIFKEAAEMAEALSRTDEAERWRRNRSQLPDFDLGEDGSLTFAKGFPYNASHRHFSHAVAIHPLNLINWTDGPEARRIIRATVKRMDDFGPNYWTGYTYAWLGNLKARMLDGNGAAEALRTFATCFCLKNTFHANGDQSGTGKSLFTYRPFTLEGNFAFAAGVQEMLLQSHTGVIQVFPAIPDEWENVSFSQLRAMGGHLVSATLQDGQLTELKVYSEQGGKVRFGVPAGPEARRTIEVDVPKGKWMTVLER